MIDHAERPGGRSFLGQDLGVNLGPGLDPGLDVMAGAAALGGVRLESARLDLKSVAWALYGGARDPYVIMITIYIFAPYFSTVVVGDPVRGQALVANISMIYGLFVAVTAPFVGAAIDKIGRRKPLLALITALMVPLIFSLWWVKPGGAGMGLGVTSVIFGLIGALFAYCDIFHNALLSRAARSRQIPYASGLALSLGNFFSVFMLVFVLWAFALPGKVPWGFIPKHPLFGLNPLNHETDRIVGPIVACFFALGALPLFLFSPDASPTGVGVLKGLSLGFEGLKQTLRTLKGHRSAAVFLGARMLYTDGMTALLIFTGVYAAGVMHWHTLDLLAYGICLSVFAVVGGQLGARLDAGIGPKRAVQIEILGAVICLCGTIGTARDKMLFVLPFDPAAHAPLWQGPIFRTLPEVVFLLIGCCSAVFVTAQYASSRTFLTRLAPAGQQASFFGLYALSSTVTLWLGSMLVSIFTAVFKTQQAGFAPIAMLLMAGFIAMLFVRHDGREA